MVKEGNQLRPYVRDGRQRAIGTANRTGTVLRICYQNFGGQTAIRDLTYASAPGQSDDT
jgi:hypothetical protein